MITLKEPIKLKNRTVTTLGDSFGERIRENYHQISVSIEPEDLLHIVTQPAEVFYAEGNQTSIFNRNIKIENVNEEKIQIMNQLINRILVSGQANFTYQDRVYISNVLRKLGITDEKRFMKSITQMIENRQSETKELKELTSRVDTLRERIPEVMESIKKRSENVASTDRVAESRLFLAESIYNRLQTERIYDTVWNFNTNAKNEQNITQKEINISEQKRSSSHIKLNNLAMNIVGAPVEMVHVEHNVFEEPEVENIMQLKQEEVQSQLIEGALFHLIKQIYESRNTKIDQGITTSFNVTNAMFESAGNIFTRYVENIIAPVVEKTVTNETAQPMVRQVLNYLEQQEITERSETTVVNELEQVSQQNIENRNHYLRVMQQLRERTLERDVPSKRTPDRTIRESLDALDNPAPLLLQYREEQAQALSQVQAQKDMLLEAYPEKVRPLLKFIDGIMAGQASGVLPSVDPGDALSSLNADIAEIEMQHRETVAPRIVETDENQVVFVEQLVDQIKGAPQKRVISSHEESVNQLDKNIQLVHKLTETVHEEEILERIDELRNETRENRTVTTTENSDIMTTINREKHEERVVNETVNETELTEMVRQHVISQMGDLSDQVYARIEKRLQNEKIRRGF